MPWLIVFQKIIVSSPSNFVVRKMVISVIRKNRYKFKRTLILLVVVFCLAKVIVLFVKKGKYNVLMQTNVNYIRPSRGGFVWITVVAELNEAKTVIEDIGRVLKTDVQRAILRKHIVLQTRARNQHLSDSDFSSEFAKQDLHTQNNDAVLNWTKKTMKAIFLHRFT